MSRSEGRPRGRGWHREADIAVVTGKASSAALTPPLRNRGRALVLRHSPRRLLGNPMLNGLATMLHRAAVRDGRLDSLATTLGVPLFALLLMDVGWHPRRRCWSFPMVNASGDVVGIKLRLPDGCKRDLAGFRAGLFYAQPFPDEGPVLVVEGPTDTAAGLALGFPTVGLPSASRGGWSAAEQELAYLVAGRDVVVIADRDANGTGQAHARRLAARLVLVTSVASVRLVCPDAKDLREWLGRGLTPQHLAGVIAAAPSVGVEVGVRQ